MCQYVSISLFLFNFYEELQNLCYVLVYNFKFPNDVRYFLPKIKYSIKRSIVKGNTQRKKFVPVLI